MMKSGRTLYYAMTLLALFRYHKFLRAYELFSGQEISGSKGGLCDGLDGGSLGALQSLTLVVVCHDGYEIFGGGGWET